MYVYRIHAGGKIYTFLVPFLFISASQRVVELEDARWEASKAEMEENAALLAGMYVQQFIRTCGRKVTATSAQIARASASMTALLQNVSSQPLMQMQSSMPVHAAPLPSASSPSASSSSSSSSSAGAGLEDSESVDVEAELAPLDQACLAMMMDAVHRNAMTDTKTKAKTETKTTPTKVGRQRGGDTEERRETTTTTTASMRAQKAENQRAQRDRAGRNAPGVGPYISRASRGRTGEKHATLYTSEDDDDNDDASEQEEDESEEEEEEEDDSDNDKEEEGDDDDDESIDSDEGKEEEEEDAVFRRLPSTYARGDGAGRPADMLAGGLDASLDASANSSFLVTSAKAALAKARAQAGIPSDASGRNAKTVLKRKKREKTSMRKLNKKEKKVLFMKAYSPSPSSSSFSPIASKANRYRVAAAAVARNAGTPAT